MFRQYQIFLISNRYFKFFCGITLSSWFLFINMTNSFIYIDLSTYESFMFNFITRFFDVMFYLGILILFISFYNFIFKSNNVIKNNADKLFTRYKNLFLHTRFLSFFSGIFLGSCFMFTSILNIIT